VKPVHFSIGTPTRQGVEGGTPSTTATSASSSQVGETDQLPAVPAFPQLAAAPDGKKKLREMARADLMKLEKETDELLRVVRCLEAGDSPW
jgi:hypothetical protein